MTSKHLAVLLVAAWLGVPMISAAKGPALTIRTVRFVVEHAADGHKYPTSVQESYELAADGTVRYTAYFGGMPTDMNHMDSISWPSKGAGAHVLAVALALARDPTSGMTVLADGVGEPNNGVGSYVVGVTAGGVDSTRIVIADKRRAWRELDAAFHDLVAQLEHATGRPLKAAELSQSAAPRDDVVARAATLANAALDRAYAQFVHGQHAQMPAHTGVWVDAAGAVVDKDTITWTHFAPAGFELDAAVRVGKDGTLAIVRATASFAAD